MQIGLFFGSFNPIHIGHLIIANHFVEFTEIEEVWFVVSPQNPLKERENLLNAQDRVKLVELAIEDNPTFKVCKDELTLPKPSYTINTLNALKQKHSQHHFKLLMGSDNLDQLHEWKDYHQVLAYGLFIYERPGYPAKNYRNNEIVKFFDFPFLNISATYIRDCIRAKKSVKYLIPPAVLALIKEKGFFK